MKKAAVKTVAIAAVLPLKYAQLRQLSQAEKDQQELQYEVEQANLQLDSDISATRQSLNKKNKEVLALKTSANFSSKSIIDAEVEAEKLQNGLDRLIKLKEELF